MFKSVNSVPEVYVNKSRDFQLLCRLLDSVVGYTHVNVDKILNSINPLLCEERVLPLLATRVGFFYDEYIPANVLRSILSVYPYIKKNKGTIRAIRAAVTAVLRSVSDTTYVDIVLGDDEDSHLITIYSDGTVENVSYLKIVLRNVVPSGYNVKFVLNINEYPDRHSDIEFKDVITIRREHVAHSTRIISSPKDMYKPTEDELKAKAWDNMSKPLSEISESSLTTYSTKINHLVRVSSNSRTEGDNRVVYVNSDIKE